MVQFTKLRLSGFKSFIEATEVPIEPGITGIVGPNGCGKSNLVEALRWVMGETSAKRMRGGEMDDVIFSGSVSRPSRNFADVMLALDNSERKAPAMFNDFDDIEVERKIERGSGSTYRVNGREVRARDVQLLFADAATGAHSTALVSQGRVGALINAKPTQRRALLEEAAGITGLHSRRHEAELRLKAAETNLERLDDVIATLDAQLQSLKKQARQAARYRNLAGHIRRQEAILLHLEIGAAESELSQARSALKEAETAVVEATRKTAEASTEQSEAAAALPPLRQDEAAAAAARQRLEVERENLEREEAQVAAARIQAGQRLNQIDGDRAREEALAEDATAAQTRLEEERGRLEIAAETEAEAHKVAEQRRDRASASVAEAERRLEELAEKVAADDARAASLARRIDELGERVKRLASRSEELEGQRRTLAVEQVSESALAEAVGRLASEERAFGELRGSAEAGDRSLTQARAQEGEARERLRGGEATASEQRAERSAILNLLEAAESDRFPPLIDALAVDPGYETALGAALGDDIIAPADEAAPLHWRSLPPLETPPPLPEGCEPLSAFVNAPPVLARRLSQIGVVTDEASGERLRAGLGVGQRLVSRQGGLWRWDGLTAKAEAPTAAAQRLRQRNRLDELKAALELSDRAVAEAARVHQEAQAAAEQAAA
ncbi:MAG: AAA family ATPase, partial [Kiloniellales bacterium]